METLKLNKAEISTFQQLIAQSNQIKQQLTEFAKDCLYSREVDLSSIIVMELSSDGTKIIYDVALEKKVDPSSVPEGSDPQRIQELAGIKPTLQDDLATK
jgi:hypothetical protein